MDRNEILEAIDAIMEHYPAYWRRIDNEIYLVVENPDYGHIASEEDPVLLIDFKVLRELVAK